MEAPLPVCRQRRAAEKPFAFLRWAARRAALELNIVRRCLGRFLPARCWPSPAHDVGAGQPTAKAKLRWPQVERPSAGLRVFALEAASLWLVRPRAASRIRPLLALVLPRPQNAGP